MSALLALTGTALGLGGGTPAQAATGGLAYNCSLPLGNAATIVINATTTADDFVAPGTVIEPSLKSTVTLSEEFVQGLRERGITTLSGKGTSSITTNGASTPVNHTFPATSLPSSGALTVIATGKMAKITVNDTITYRPGNVSLTLSATGGFNADIAASCTMPAGGASTVIDTVEIGVLGPPPVSVKATSGIGIKATYAKATKKLAVLARVKTSSGKVPTGTVKVALYKRGKFFKGATVALKNGTVKPVFRKVGKGAYSLVVTYNGSKVVEGSKATRRFTLR